MHPISSRLTYKHTLLACYVGYLTQSLVINFSPLLFVTFMSVYGLSLPQTTVLIGVSFTTQLTVDLLTSRWVKRLGARAVTILAHVCAVLGVTGLSVLPEITPSPMIGLILATVLGSIGGGIIEVVISPLAEACPTEQKRGTMSLLHSFYAWGQAATILLSTVFFATVGLEHWRTLACLWALLPALGALAFTFVPIYELPAPTPPVSDKTAKVRSPIYSKTFLMFFILRICAGASEQAMSQWASTFAEVGLGVDKSLGDLLGPCAFALLMGLSRTLHGLFSRRIPHTLAMLTSCSLCVVSFLLAAFAPHPLLALIGCALCGFSVGILWPGTYSTASERLSGASVTMFALLAFGGDLGCLIGPALMGSVASMLGGGLRPAFLFALIFPLAAILLTLTDLFHTKGGYQK